jgi:Sec-independent protein translocase protein TatA
MFGVGAQEIVIIVTLLLVIFGPAKLGHMARELGRFAYKARASMDEFKEQFSVVEYPDPDHEEPRRSHSEHQPEATPQQPPTKTAQPGRLLAANESSNDSSLLTPPVNDAIVAKSPERVTFGVRE